MKRVLLAMSGGTDSSVCAILLKQQGYEVVGLHISFFSESWASTLVMSQQASAVENVNELCKSLDISYIEKDASQEFYSIVIQYFVSSYKNGETPFPCAKCNPLLKWKLLYETAQEQNCDFIATGHYVKKIEQDGLFYLSQGVDPDKDQSFFLWGLHQEILAKALFPLGHMHKTEVRAFAAEHGYTSVSERKDSLGVCFLGNSDYRPFIQKELKKQGIVVPQGIHYDSMGNELGKNDGYLFYTIGQRKQLGVNCNKRLFVKSLDAQNNAVVLSEYTELYKSSFVIHDYYFASNEDMQKELIVKIRYRKQANLCTLTVLLNNTLQVNLHKPLEAIAPGQTAVFYDGNLVVGGGFIL